jgi:tetratricopeptide (TPR) repeat protein
VKPVFTPHKLARLMWAAPLLLALSAHAAEPPQELTPKLLYQILLAEIAAQRDQLGISVHVYQELARSTHDPRVAQRAAEMALYAHEPQEALAAISLWLEEEPASREAREALGALLLSEGRLQDARDVLVRLLAADKDRLGEDFRSLSLIFSQYQDHEAALELAQELAEPYPQVPESHYLVAATAYLAGKRDLALDAARRAAALRPGWEPAALLEARVLQEKDPAEARRFYQGFIDRYPEAKDVRLTYARYLVDQKDYATARDQFNAILKEAPNNSELTLAVALLTLQLKDYAAAEPLFLKVLSQGYRDPDTVKFYLGQVSEEQKQWDRAAQWYGQVTSGDQVMSARIKVALMMARQNQVQKGLEMLRAIPATTPEQKEQLVLAEEQMKREAHDYQGAFDTLTQALKEDPDAADLLYERAIVADKLNRMDSLEKDLRRVIALRPDYAHAYNALGYSLADRDERLDEALDLIKKALALSPNDPFIIDSLGWVQFRMGKLEDSIATLKRAFTLQDDPEIAAHLGEVQWAAGDHVAARQTWENSLKTNPDSEVLQATMHRFAH